MGNEILNSILPDTRVSVIIATRNRHQHIQRALEALLDGSRRPDEIIIYDQSNNNLTKEVVETVRAKMGGKIIRYFSSNKQGISANRNDAIAAASGDFIASVDDDVAVEKHWLENMLTEWTDNWGGSPVLITGPIFPAPELEPSALITAVRTSADRIVFEGRPQYSEVLIGAQFGAPSILFASLEPPPFDERLGAGCRYPGADDEEFAYRVQKGGYAVVYEPSIQVTHYTERVADWRSVSFKYGVGNGAAMTKHMFQGDFGVIAELLRSILINLGKSVSFAVRLREPQASGRFLAAVGLCVGFLRWTLASALGRNGAARIYDNNPT